MAPAVLSLLLAAWLGFAIRRGSVCMVRGVAEVLSTGRAHMLLSFARAVLWVLVITLPLLWLAPSPQPLIHGFAVSGPAIAGGLLFGIGAAINRGCAFSTLGRLGNGEVGAWLTLGGLAGGVWIVASAGAGWGVGSRTAVAVSYHPPAAVVSPLVAALALWGIWELARLWRTRPAGSATELLLAPSYRLSTAVALIGIANGILYALNGPWVYTRVLSDALMHPRGAAAASLALPAGLFLAVIGGALISGWQRGSFRADWRPSPTWLQDLAGGLLMGLGAALVPGGNDVLLLHSLPHLSPHALPAFLAMSAGIAMVLLVMRAFTGGTLEVDCRGDVCRTRWLAAARRRQPAPDDLDAARS